MDIFFGIYGGWVFTVKVPFDGLVTIYICGRSDDMVVAMETALFYTGGRTIENSIYIDPIQ